MNIIKNPLNVTTCMGCKKGIESFILMENQFFHVDLFSTPGEYPQYRCENKKIGDILIENDDGIFFPNKDNEVFFREQSFWWTEIITLSMDVFKSDEAIIKFLNTANVNMNKKMWNNTNEYIEKELINIAKNKGINVDIATYPDLLIWNN